MKLIEFWYQKKLHPLLYVLQPCSKLFELVTVLRRYLYRQKILKTYHPHVPVIVVGNISIGGTGKTPFVIWLAEFLKSKGFTPGIVSRGVGGKKQHMAHRVSEQDDVAIVGDEAILLHCRTQCPLVICSSRVKAIKKLLAETNCDVIISDDGLQHYAMARDIEIVMIDGKRQFGNGRLLPAGPLREKIDRLQEVDFIIQKDFQYENRSTHHHLFSMQFKKLKFIQMKTNYELISDSLPKKAHAVAGIGNPNCFFNLLEEHGIAIIPHFFKDHATFCENDFSFDDDLPIIMTEKDAVKCMRFADERFIFVQISVFIKNNFESQLLRSLTTLIN